MYRAFVGVAALMAGLDFFIGRQNSGRATAEQAGTGWGRWVQQLPIRRSRRREEPELGLPLKSSSSRLAATLESASA